MNHKTLRPLRTTSAAIFVLFGAISLSVAASGVPITSGYSDYQPSVIRSRDGKHRLVFERLDNNLSGDLWITHSGDGGENWSTPTPVITSATNERHPALLELSPSNYVLFYLKDTGATSSYRIMRATSSDGLTFTEQQPLDLGWGSGGDINPHVIRHNDGSLTMSYQRLGAGSYIARSLDGGASWDTLRTPIATGSQLPRIAFRERDGLYLASYQVGSNQLSMHVKTTPNPYDWSAPAQDFAITGNNHDSLPAVMPDGAFVLFWIVASSNQFDLRVRRSIDGLTWEPTRIITLSANEDDVQPHPLIGTSTSTVELYWGRGEAPGANNFRIVRDAAVVVSDDVFANGFERSRQSRDAPAARP